MTPGSNLQVLAAVMMSAHLVWFSSNPAASQLACVPRHSTSCSLAAVLLLLAAAVLLVLPLLYCCSLAAALLDLPLHVQAIVINLPIFVEDATHAANQRAHKYSNAVVNLVKQKHPGASMVDFQTACRQHMAQHCPKWQYAMQDMQQQGQEQSGISASSSSSASAGGQQVPRVLSRYRLTWNMVWCKFYQGMLRQRSWDEISACQGLVLLTDQVHMNATAAGILAELVRPLLQDV
jgi:hypothetical protein